MPRKSQSAGAPPELPPEQAAEEITEPAPAPYFYIAQRPLYLHGDGGMGVVAFAEGDRVPPEHVERFGWHDYVTDPFAAQQPAVSEGELHTAPLASPGAEPATESAAEPVTEPAAEPATDLPAEAPADEAAPAAQEE